MKFTTKRKLNDLKRKTNKMLCNTWYTLVYPLAWLLNTCDKYKEKRFDKKVSKLTVDDVSKLMAKQIQKELINNPKNKYELFVCKSTCNVWERVDVLTPLDELLTKWIYVNDYVYKWAMQSRDLNDVWLNGEMCQVIFDELCDIEGLDVQWNYVCEANEQFKYCKPVKDYQKHLVIKIKN